MKNDFKNILVVRTDRIGDMVLTSPSLKALRQAYPEAHIAIIISPLTYELTEKNPHVDEIIIDDRKNSHKGFLGFWKLVFQLRKKKFDCAIVLHTKKRTNALCFLAGIPYRIGYRNNKFGFLITHPIEDRRNRGEKHEVEYCLDVIRHLGIPAKTSDTVVYLNESMQAWADKWFEEHNFSSSDHITVIHPGSSDPPRRWPAERFAELIDQLHQRYNSKIIVIGTDDIADVVEKIRSASQTPFLDLTGKTSIGQLAGILKHCTLLVSNDSGPVHLADALGIGVVSIFIRIQLGVNPPRWRPFRPKNKAIFPKNLPKPNIYDQRMYPYALSTEEVLEAVDEVFKLC